MYEASDRSNDLHLLLGIFNKEEMEKKYKEVVYILGDEDLLYNGSVLQQDDMASLLRIKK